jgi:hypothetical protein
VAFLDVSMIVGGIGGCPTAIVDGISLERGSHRCGDNFAKGHRTGIRGLVAFLANSDHVRIRQCPLD